jgi:hypothetical protein
VPRIVVEVVCDHKHEREANKTINNRLDILKPDSFPFRRQDGFP